MPEHRFEDVARAALLEITPAATVGEYVGETDEGDGVVSLLFASAQEGYPDWRWTVSVTQLEGEEPTVLEAELMPAEGALLAPDWVPWSDRLAEYKAAQENAAEPTDDESDEDDESDDDDDEDESDDDEELDEDDVLGNDVLHGGDLDGVDIDSQDELDDDDSDDDEDDDGFDDDEDEESDRTY